MNLKNILSFLLITLSLSCATDLDDNPVSNTDINDFIYRGLRTYYLYNENVLLRYFQLILFFFQQKC